MKYTNADRVRPMKIRRAIADIEMQQENSEFVYAIISSVDKMSSVTKKCDGGGEKRERMRGNERSRESNKEKGREAV